MKWAYSDYYNGKNVGDEQNENIVAERKSLKPDIVYKLKGKVKKLIYYHYRGNVSCCCIQLYNKVLCDKVQDSMELVV